MLSIEQSSPSERFLMVAARVSTAAWERSCASVRSWTTENRKRLNERDVEQCLGFVNKPLDEFTLPVGILHCFADVPSGTRFDLTFDLSDFSKHQATSAVVCFGVVMDRYAQPSLSHGWHQTAVLQFREGIPSLFESLPVDRVTGPLLGLGLRKDFQQIEADVSKKWQS